MSPFHPRAYPSAAHCTWKITVSRSRYIRITFMNIDIEGKIELRFECNSRKLLGLFVKLLKSIKM